MSEASTYLKSEIIKVHAGKVEALEKELLTLKADLDKKTSDWAAALAEGAKYRAMAEERSAAVEAANSAAESWKTLANTLQNKCFDLFKSW